MAELKHLLPKPLSAIQSYGLAVVSVAVALGAALLFDRLHFGGVQVALFLFASAITAWYGGGRAAALALVLSCMGFDYFFTVPLYSLAITRTDIPYFISFASFAVLVSWFAAVRRSVEQELLHSRDDLKKELAERKQREEEIRALNEELGKRSTELEAINKELEAFAYSVSHDLRAPLRHMSGFTELLQKNAAAVLNEKSQRYIGMIMESAKRMGTLIDDLLSFSRIGRAETHKKIVNLDKLVQEALSEVRQETDGRNIEWKVGALPAWYGDDSMLRLALVNLISNAAKFTRTRSKAEIEIGCQDQKPNQVVALHSR